MKAYILLLTIVTLLTLRLCIGQQMYVLDEKLPLIAALDTNAKTVTYISGAQQVYGFAVNPATSTAYIMTDDIANVTGSCNAIPLKLVQRNATTGASTGPDISLQLGSIPSLNAVYSPQWSPIDNAIYFTGTVNGSIVTVFKLFLNGTVQQFNLNGNSASLGPRIAVNPTNGMIYSLSYTDGKIYEINFATGTINTTAISPSFSVNGPITISVNGTNLYAFVSGILYEFSTANGNPTSLTFNLASVLNGTIDYGTIAITPDTFTTDIVVYSPSIVIMVTTSGSVDSSYPMPDNFMSDECDIPYLQAPQYALYPTVYVTQYRQLYFTNVPGQGCVIQLEVPVTASTVLYSAVIGTGDTLPVPSIYDQALGVFNNGSSLAYTDDKQQLISVNSQTGARTLISTLSVNNFRQLGSGPTIGNTSIYTDGAIYDMVVDPRNNNAFIATGSGVFMVNYGTGARSSVYSGTVFTGSLGTQSSWVNTVVALAWDQFPPNLLMFISDWTASISSTGNQTGISISRSRILSINVDTLVAQSSYIIDSANNPSVSISTSTAALAVNENDGTIYLGLRTSGQILSVTRSSNTTSISVLATLPSTPLFSMKLEPSSTFLAVFSNNDILSVTVASGAVGTLYNGSSGFAGPCFFTPLTGIPTAAFVIPTASTAPVLSTSTLPNVTTSISPSLLPSSLSVSTVPLISASQLPSPVFTTSFSTVPALSPSPAVTSVLPGQSASPSPEQILTGSASVAKSWLSFLF